MSQLFNSSNVKSLLQQDPPAVPNEEELLQALVAKLGPHASRAKLLFHIRVSAGKVHWAVNSYFRSILATAWPEREDFDSKHSSGWQLAAHRPDIDAAIPTCAAGAAVPVDGIQQQQQGRLESTEPAAGAAAEPSRSKLQLQQQQQIPALKAAGGCAAASLCSDDAPSICGGPASSNTTGATAVAPVKGTDSATAAAAAAIAPAEVLLESLPGNVLETILSVLDLPSLLSAASSCNAMYKAAQAERLWQQLFKQRWGAVIFPTNKYSSRGPGGSRAGSNAFGSAGSGSGAVITGGSTGASAAVAAAAAAVAAGPGAAEPARPAADGRRRAPHFDAGVLQSTLSPNAAGAAQLAPAVTSHSMNGSTPAADGAAGAAMQPPVGSHTGGSSSSSFVSRWTGSCVSGRGGGCSGGADCHALDSANQHAAAAAGGNGNATVASQAAAPAAAAGPAAGMPASPCRRNASSSCSCSSCAMLPSTAPAGSWRLQYKQQYSYQAVRKCPKCGAATVVPVVYGFPSAPLLAGMGLKRLVLGGDHLIESCHCWACNGCRACFRYFPYGDVQLWLQDDEAQQRFDQARAAAGRSSRAGQQGSAAGELGGPGEDEGDAGFPRYTYEL